MKAHKLLTIYMLVDDDINRIEYQVKDAADEAIEQVSQKQEELHHQV